MYARFNSQQCKTAPAMAVSFMEGYNLPYGKIMATSTLIVIPVIIFALIASKQLVRGLTMGAVKELLKINQGRLDQSSSALIKRWNELRPTGLRIDEERFLVRVAWYTTLRVWRRAPQQNVLALRLE